MPPLFRRKSNLQCFFCHSAIAFPVNAHNFKCSSCGLWNRYDAQGEIISDEPAMHTEHLNSRSFAKRASSSTDRLPTSYGPGPFCHSCQTNQMLQMNLLAHYLPDEESSEYESRLKMLPAYRDSLNVRYPPVCEPCLPQVEEEMRKKEQMARASALGGWLSKGRDRKRRSSGPDLAREKKVSDAIFWWRVRGCLWANTLGVSTIGTLSAVFQWYPFRFLSFLQPVLPLFAALSILWTAWDPTYVTFYKSQSQGRDVRLHGKRTHNTLQIFGWSIRLCTSILLSLRWFRPDVRIIQLGERASRIYFMTTFVLESTTIALSYCVLRIQQPPSIRLVDTPHNLDSLRATPNPDSRGSTPTTFRFPSSTEHDTLHTLSLSSKPIITHKNPVFGIPSLQGSLHTSQTPARREKNLNNDDMDWTPTHPDTMSSFEKPNTTGAENDNIWLRPQRFFPPEKPTGLEGLFESTRIQEDEPMPFQGTTHADDGNTSHLWKWVWLYTPCLVIVVASIAYTWKWSGLTLWAI